jgi:hypothetical protein
MIAAVTVMIFVAISFADNILNNRLAENEFEANKQFMITTGLQIDDVAWTVGRTQTIRYSSRVGHVKFQSLALSYLIEVNRGSGWETVFNASTGMIMFNMPTTEYNLGNNYFERISPSTDGSFLQEGPSAPVSHVFVVEKLSVPEENFIRVVAVPSVRMLSSTIVGQQSTANYSKFYLPILSPASGNPHRSQSVTITGDGITKYVEKDVDRVRITVSFPSAGFEEDFFRFGNELPYENSIEMDLPPDSVVEFYLGRVIVTLGQV